MRGRRIFSCITRTSLARVTSRSQKARASRSRSVRAKRAPKRRTSHQSHEKTGALAVTGGRCRPRTLTTGGMIAQKEKPVDCPRVGDTVVYASHGIGRVVAREQKPGGGAEDDCIVVDLDTGLRVTLSLQDAAERLRSVADEKELEDV